MLSGPCLTVVRQNSCCLTKLSQFPARCTNWWRLDLRVIGASGFTINVLFVHVSGPGRKFQ